MLHPAGLAVGPHEPPRLLRALRLAEQEYDLVLPARRQLEPRHQGGAGVAELAGPVGELRPAEGGGRVRRAVPPQELGPVGGERARAAPHVGEGDPPGKISRPGASGEQSAALRVERADYLQRGQVAEHAQHPLDVERR